MIDAREVVEGYILRLPWSDDASPDVKFYVAGNLRGFANWLYSEAAAGALDCPRCLGTRRDPLYRDGDSLATLACSECGAVPSLEGEQHVDAPEAALSQEEPK